MYPNGVRDVIDLLTNWEGNETYYAEYQMARILKVILFHRLTDMYGDVPYSEAGKGYYENLGYPVYDTQESIYLDMLKELKENPLYCAHRNFGGQFFCNKPKNKLTLLYNSYIINFS